jgi:hypothetical protein
VTGFAAYDPPKWLAVTTISVDDATRARTRFSQLLNLRVFQQYPSTPAGRNATNVALICARDLEGSSVRTTDACARMAAVSIADAAVDNHVGTGHE